VGWEVAVGVGVAVHTTAVGCGPSGAAGDLVKSHTATTMVPAMMPTRRMKHPHWAMLGRSIGLSDTLLLYGVSEREQAAKLGMSILICWGCCGRGGRLVGPQMKGRFWRQLVVS
jgi:hypothetical protein